MLAFARVARLGARDSRKRRLPSGLRSSGFTDASGAADLVSVSRMAAPEALLAPDRTELMTCSRLLWSLRKELMSSQRVARATWARSRDLSVWRGVVPSAEADFVRRLLCSWKKVVNFL